MITKNMISMINSVFQTPQASPTKTLPKSIMENPFASPFVGSAVNRHSFDGKNQPVKGGYFAGYYNGKKNVVGKKLFLTV